MVANCQIRAEPGRRCRTLTYIFERDKSINAFASFKSQQLHRIVFTVKNDLVITRENNFAEQFHLYSLFLSFNLLSLCRR